MADRFRLTLAQLNPTLGALEANADKALAAWKAGREAGADMVALPEMFVTGYQTQDLMRRVAFHDHAVRVIDQLARDTADGPALGIGGPWVEEDRIYNAYHVLQGGKTVARMLKHHLPTEDVFDEKRIFSQGPISGPCRIGPLRIGIPVCEDAWHEDVAETLAETGAEVLFIPNGSPYRRDKMDLRMNVIVARVVETGLPAIYLNTVGAQDDQVFDGGSFALNPGGALALQTAGDGGSDRACGLGTRHRWLAHPARADGSPARRVGARLSRDGAVDARLSKQVGVRQGPAGPVGRCR